jgi:hypothetical protein
VACYADSFTFRAVFIVCNVFFIACVALCAVFCLSVVCYFMWYVHSCEFASVIQWLEFLAEDPEARVHLGAREQIQFHRTPTLVTYLSALVSWPPKLLREHKQLISHNSPYFWSWPICNTDSKVTSALVWQQSHTSFPPSWYISQHNCLCHGWGTWNLK